MIPQKNPKTPKHQKMKTTANREERVHEMVNTWLVEQKSSIERLFAPVTANNTGNLHPNLYCRKDSRNSGTSTLTRELKTLVLTEGTRITISSGSRRNVYPFKQVSRVLGSTTLTEIPPTANVGMWLSRKKECYHLEKLSYTLKHSSEKD